MGYESALSPATATGLSSGEALAERRYSTGSSPEALARVKELVRDVYGFPRPGVTFKDITPLLGDAEVFAGCVEAIAEHFASRDVSTVLGVEARGFIIAAPVAFRLGAAFVPVRKKGKLPWHVHSYTYELEYGTDTLEVHTDALRPGERALIVDDVLATGGTALATWHLVERLGAQAVGFGCVLELGFLGGRSKLSGLDVLALASYD